MDYQWEMEYFMQRIFDIETNCGLVWFNSIRDEYRYMWE